MDSNTNVFLESIHHGYYDLSYTCLLIPRLAHHHLLGDLAECLPEGLQKICTLNNWPMEFITVEADYFQWGLRAGPSIQTGQFMQEIRQKTSELIMTTFEYIRGESPANDFWAPGYLVVLGIRPHPAEMIEHYIRLSRRQQASPPAAFLKERF